MSEITNRIDTLLTERKLKRSDLCRGTGIPESTIRGWITHNNFPAIDYMIKIAEFFGVSVEYLYYGYSTNSSEENKSVYRLNLTESELIQNYRILDDRDKEDLIEFTKLKASRYSNTMGGNITAV